MPLRADSLERLSRLSDQEIKALMSDVVNKTYRALRVLFDDRLGSEVINILTQQDLVPRWDEPTTDLRYALSDRWQVALSNS
jgi:hypothetical protein